MTGTDNLERELISKYETELQTLKRDSKLLNRHASIHCIPNFECTELAKGNLLGEGGFSFVHEIRSINLLDSNTAVKEETSDNDDGSIQEEDDDNFASSATRLYMSQNTVRDGQSRYAIKILRNDFDTQPPPPNLGSTMTDREYAIKKKCRGMLDLAIEAEYLQKISHPNIIKMRGLSSIKMESDSFLVLDRLYATLEETIRSTWSVHQDEINKASSKNILKAIFCSKQHRQSRELQQQDLQLLFLERLKVAYDIASAIRFLHGKRLIYRDVKSENIGFDVRGDVKIFDFGLCKELPSIAKGRNQVYELTGRTGSMPYMAPEIYHCQAYNEKVDAYSFAVLLYEIFTLELPFQGFCPYDYKHKVYSSKLQYRPKLQSTYGKWPIVVTSLVKECWQHHGTKRPEFERIASVLKAEMSELSQTVQEMNASIENRTKHLLDRSIKSRQEKKLTRDSNLDRSQRSTHFRMDRDMDS